MARNYYKKERNNIKILEVGCGTGANIWYLSREGFKCYGIDGSQTAIKRATQRLNEEGLKAQLVVGDIVNLSFDDNYFDAVIDCECIYANDLINSQKALLEVKRVLKEGGKFYSRTFSDRMYVGNTHTHHEKLEYSNISDGPLEGKGFVRLSSEESIKKLYGEIFEIVSIDSLEYTSYNKKILTSEFVIICNGNK
ncbi:MAG: class I SAM-dependent methyltransferase [Bacteroidetes bacterium]|nr:class I SAM-dependent methyltransferase [Bacteroidota bacterium]